MLLPSPHNNPPRFLVVEGPWLDSESNGDDNGVGVDDCSVLRTIST